MSFDWKSTLSTIAPVLATALGGPMAGVAVKMATQALGLSSGDESSLEMAIASGDPKILVTLKQVENDFKLEMERLGVEVKKLDVKDRGSAREMGIAKGLTAQTLLSAIFILGFLYILGMMFGGYGGIPPEMMQPAMYLLGILSAGIIQIMNFWFGSSSGSKEKTQGLLKK